MTKGNAQVKAIVYTKYGPPDVLELREMDKPAPKEGEVLVRIHVAAANAFDWHLMRAKPFLVRLMGTGFRRPKNTMLGADVAGTVETIGSGVSQFRPGDEVFGDLAACGCGGFAEYACARADALVLKPANLTFEEAAAAPMAAITALQALRDKGMIRAGQAVLINGASGGVGTFAVQIAKSFGAVVTAVCSARNVDLVRTLGADCVIDYGKENFSKSDRRYDLILGANGYHSAFAYRRALKPGGIYVMSGGSDAQMFQCMLLGPLLSLTGSKKTRSVMAKITQSDLLVLKGLLESGKVKSVIDRRYTLPETADAIRYLEQGHARGKVVITM